MPLIAADWSVVIAGRWNRAILTPSGVAKRLFRLEIGTNVDVFIPLDEVGRYQIRHDGCVVEVTRDFLLIQPVEPKTEFLLKAMRVGINALEELPETPVSAVGVNLRFNGNGIIKGINETVSKDSLDIWLADSKFVIRQRTLKRSLDYDGGSVNIEITLSDDLKNNVHFNFEKLDTSTAGLKEWLQKPETAFEGTAKTILTHLCFDEEDNPND